MRFAVAIVIASAGCKGLLGIDDGIVADPVKDAGDDAMPDARTCYGPAAYELCLVPSMDAIALGVPATIDTTTCFGGTIDSRNWCVIAVRTLRIDTTITVAGSRALVLLASESLTVTKDAYLDASSHGTAQGAGANAAACANAGEGTAAVLGGSGGAGGTLGTRGGDGGRGNIGLTVAGIAAPTVAGDIDLRGGCKGGRGGSPSDGPGDGGGALYLVAGEQVAIHGAVNASGAGGGGGKASKGGGSGGGSGGVIFLAAPQIIMEAATIWANGGGGGGGADNGAAGITGGTSSSPATFGAGGPGGSQGTGHGGAGAIGIQPANEGTDDTTAAGGGGGGGGVGAIRVFGTVITEGLLSPPSS